MSFSTVGNGWSVDIIPSKGTANEAGQCYIVHDSKQQIVCVTGYVDGFIDFLVNRYIKKGLWANWAVLQVSINKTVQPSLTCICRAQKDEILFAKWPFDKGPFASCFRVDIARAKGEG